MAMAEDVVAQSEEAMVQAERLLREAMLKVVARICSVMLVLWVFDASNIHCDPGVFTSSQLADPGH